jgi:hypothetical protein
MAHKYGDTGNRWWAAYNTSQSLFSANLYSPSGYESLPSGNATDDALFAAAAALTAVKAFPAGKGPVISVENVHWANVNGPYPTQAAANAEVAKLQKKAPAPGTDQQAENQAKATVAKTLLGFLESDQLWTRIGEVILGLLLITVGVAKLAEGTPLGKLAIKTGLMA